MDKMCRRLTNCRVNVSLFRPQSVVSSTDKFCLRSPGGG